MDITLTTLDDTKRLGRALAEALSASGRPQLVLLEGGLGAGKTTLTRFLVEALPGGSEAEVSSPSFTLCNIYPTRPEVRHYDLYRLEDGLLPDAVPDEVLDALDQACAEQSGPEPGPAEDRILMLVEWPERLPPEVLPPSRIYCRLTAEQNDRRASFTGHGKSASEVMERLRALLFPAEG